MTPHSDEKKTPTATHRHPPARATAQTAHDLLAASQEIVAEKGVVPSEAQVERRAMLRRQGRTERKLFWYTLAQTFAVGVVFALPKIADWADAHREMAGGLVGLIGIVCGGAAIAFRLRPISKNDDPPRSGGEGA